MNETKVSESKPKRAEGRNVATALGIACIILVAGVGGVIAYYTMQINNKDSTVKSLQTNLQDAENNYTNYVNDHHYTDEQYTQAIANKPAKLIAVDLKSDDSRPSLGTPYLHVYGYLCNVGSVAATNVKIHVVGYQSSGVVAINTDIVLGSIAAEAWIKVDDSPTYGGSALTSWAIMPTWS
jgi:hypothetical protein